MWVRTNKILPNSDKIELDLFRSKNKEKNKKTEKRKFQNKLTENKKLF